MGRAHQRARHGLRGIRIDRQFGQAEVQQFSRALGRYQNVRRLQIPVQDAFTVGVFERAGNLNGQLESLLYRHGTGNRRAIHVFHDEVVGTNIVERADIRMIQRRYRARFPLEAFGKLCRADFDRDCPIQSRIARLIHLSR